MKYLPLLIFVLLGLTVSSCKKNNDSVAFELDFEKNFEIGAGLDPFLVHFYVINDIQSLLAARLDQNSMTLADVTSINPQSALIFSIDGSQEYDFISRVSLLAESEDGVIEKEIFYREDVPFNVGSELNMLPTLVDVKELFDQGKYNVKIRLTLRDISPSSIPSRLRMKFLVKD